MINVPDQVKELYKIRQANSNLVITFPFSNHASLDNSSIKKESFAFTESLGEGGTIKLGINDLYQVTFEALTDDLTGQVIDVNIVTTYDYSNYSIPFGRFKVSSCKIVDLKNGIRKVTAFSSQYDDVVDAGKEIGIDSLNSIWLEGLYAQMADDKTGINTTLNISGYTTSYSTYSSKLFKYNNSHYLVSVKNTDVYYSDSYEKAYYYSISNKISWGEISTAIGRVETITGITFPDDVFNEIHTAISAWVQEIGRIVDHAYYASANQYLKRIPINFTIEVYLTNYSSKIGELATDYGTISCKYKTGAASTIIDFDKIKGTDFYRDFLQSYTELIGKFGRISRANNKFETFDLCKFNGLVPGEELTPSATLVPSNNGSVETISNSCIESINEISDLSKPYGFIYACYRDSASSDLNYFTYKISDDATELTHLTYDISENWMLNNCIISYTVVVSYCEAIAAALTNVRFNAMDIDVSGMPWIEAGDALEVQIDGKTYVSYLLERKFNGIKNTADNISSY